VGRDLLQPTYRFVTGSGGGRVPFRQELSAALHWNRESTLTGGWAQTARGETSLNIGLEILFYDVLAIRSGLFNLSPIYQANGNPEKFQFTGGFGIFHKGYRVDATAFSNHDLGASYRVTLLVPLARGAGR
jgi:hypothetical protein